MPSALFDSYVWTAALEKYAAVTHLTVELFDANGLVVLGRVHPTPLFQLFQDYGFDPGVFTDCAQRCLAQKGARPAVVVAESHGLNVIGTSLVLEGEIVGAAVGGYTLADFSQVPAIQRLARVAAVPFDRLWDVALHQSPVPQRRLLIHGELLQVLGDALLVENHRSRQHEETAMQLRVMSAAKDEFLAVLSHELRTPLTPIVGWARILKESDSMDQMRHGAEVIERNALLQTKLVEDLLDVNRLSRGSLRLDLKIHDMSDVIRATLEAMAHDIHAKALRLETVEADQPLPVEGDAARLQQIFRNILSNAVKFTRGGGSIRVTVTRDASDVIVVVTDTGIGIAPEFLPSVFDIFSQQERGTRREYDGLGVGLALVKRLLAIQKGTVTIASPGRGRGTEVIVRLPLVTDARNIAPATHTITRNAASPFVGLSILLVEDVEDSREALRILLESLGANVLVAGNGREALDQVQTGDPDLVLCDLRMPRMDGFEFIHQLHDRPSSAHLPVVAVSGFAGDADRERTRQAGFDGHLKKPVDEAAMVAAVSAALGHNHTRP